MHWEWENSNPIYPQKYHNCLTFSAVWFSFFASIIISPKISKLYDFSNPLLSHQLQGEYLNLGSSMSIVILCLYLSLSSFKGGRKEKESESQCRCSLTSDWWVTLRFALVSFFPPGGTVLDLNLFPPKTFKGISLPQLVFLHPFLSNWVK